MASAIGWGQVVSRNQNGQARNRQDNLQNYWKREEPPIDFKGYDWRATLIRRDHRGAQRILKLTPVITGANWSDKALVEATVNFQNPSKETPLPIKAGYEVRLDWAEHGSSHYRNMWELRVEDINRDAGEGGVEATLVNEMTYLARVEDDFSFKAAKKNQPAQGKRVKGWYAHQVAREVCRRYGIRAGRFAKGKHLIKNLSLTKSSPLQVIAKAYAEDRAETGRKFVIGERDGKLQVTQLKRSKDMLVLAENLLSAMVNESMKETFATALHVTGTLGHKVKKATDKAKGKTKEEEEEEKETAKEDKAKGKKKERTRHKLDIEVKSSDAVVKRFGLIKADWDIGDPVSSEAVARERAKRRLAHFQEPKLEVSITLPGIPTLKRGDSILLDLKGEGFRKLVYVKEVSHSVGASGEYTMEVTCMLTDYFIDKQGEKIREQQCEKARKKDRTPPSFCSDGFEPFAPAHPSRSDSAVGQTGQVAK